MAPLVILDRLRRARHALEGAAALAFILAAPGVALLTVAWANQRRGR